MAPIILITPTIGRPSLEPCLERAQQLLRPGDLHIVAVDAVHTPTERLQQILVLSLPMVHTLPVSSLRSVSGNAQRDAAISLAHTLVPPGGSYLVFNDDDDLLHPDGAALLHALEPDGNLHLFSMAFRGCIISPTENEPITMKGNIGGSNLAPSLRPDIPKWMDVNVYEADVFFYARCKQLYPKIIAHKETLIQASGWSSRTATSWSLVRA